MRVTMEVPAELLAQIMIRVDGGGNPVSKLERMLSLWNEVHKMAGPTLDEGGEYICVEPLSQWSRSNQWHPAGRYD